MTSALKGLYYIQRNDDYLAHGQVIEQLDGEFCLVKPFDKETHEPLHYLYVVSLHDAVEGEWHFFESLDDLKTAWREGLDDDEDAALKIVPIGSGRGKEKP